MRQSKIFSLIFLCGILGQAFATDAPCDKMCITLYDPVCADCHGTLKTFSNSCVLGVENECHNAGCIHKHNGECVEKPKCPVPCPRIYKPVCAWNGTDFATFSSDCTLTAHNQCSNKYNSFIKITECSCSISD